MDSKFLRAFFVLAFAGLLAASAAPFSAAKARGDGYRSHRAVQRFDGHWSVVINTLRGDCGQSLRYSVRIVNGRVLGEESSYQVAGSVAANGAIRVVVAEGGRSASGYGRLYGNYGHGRWHTASGQCSGVWQAERRGGW
jgi:hypothetical protein